MSKIKSFDPNQCTVLRHELELAVKSVEKKLGIIIKIGKMGYSASNVKMSVEAAVVASDGLVLSKEAEAFKVLADMYGLKPTDLGTTFKLKGSEYRITGLNSRAGKMPVNGTRVADGATFKFPVSSVLMALGRPARVNEFA